MRFSASMCVSLFFVGLAPPAWALDNSTLHRPGVSGRGATRSACAHDLVSKWLVGSRYADLKVDSQSTHSFYNSYWQFPAADDHDNRFQTRVYRLSFGSERIGYEPRTGNYDSIVVTCLARGHSSSIYLYNARGEEILYGR